MRKPSRRDDPPARGGHLDVIKIKLEVRSFVALSTCVKGFDTHWMNGRTRPHYENKRSCPGCQQKAPMRWKGFLHITGVDLRGEAFLEITPEGALQLMESLKPGDVLRGRQFSTRRTKNTIKSPLVLDLTNIIHPEENLIAERDPLFTVMKMWGQV